MSAGGAPPPSSARKDLYSESIFTASPGFMRATSCDQQRWTQPGRGTIRETVPKMHRVRWPSLASPPYIAHTAPTQGEGAPHLGIHFVHLGLQLIRQPVDIDGFLWAVALLVPCNQRRALTAAGHTLEMDHAACRLPTRLATDETELLVLQGTIQCCELPQLQSARSSSTRRRMHELARDGLLGQRHPTLPT